MAVEQNEAIADVLYPPLAPYRNGLLEVGGGHQIYFEESGNPAGFPVLFVHGGPGSQTRPAHRRFFDPQFFRIVLFDQRGCGQSKPQALLADNTTSHLVADMERLRGHLNINRWLLFGGSCKPEFVLPKIEPPAPVVEPKIEARPEPKVEPLPPVAKTEPPPQPAIERALDPLPDTRSNVVPDARPVPPAVVAPQSKAPDDNQERASTDRYTQLISAWVRRKQEYPPAAIRRGWEGTTVVQLRLTAEGQVADIVVVGKSGHDVLDEAAIKMVRSAAPLPTPPEGLRSVLVPIKFRLDS